MCLCTYLVHLCVRVYLEFSFIPEIFMNNHDLDSRTNPILKEGGDVMKRGRASLLMPLMPVIHGKQR